MPRADCSSNTTRDSISMKCRAKRVHAPRLRPLFTRVLHAARSPSTQRRSRPPFTRFCSVHALCSRIYRPVHAHRSRIRCTRSRAALTRSRGPAHRSANLQTGFRFVNQACVAYSLQTGRLKRPVCRPRVAVCRLSRSANWAQHIHVTDTVGRRKLASTQNVCALFLVLLNGFAFRDISARESHQSIP